MSLVTCSFRCPPIASCPSTKWPTGHNPTALISFPTLSHTVVPLSCPCCAGVMPSGFHQSQHITSVSSNLEETALGQMIQGPPETHSENSSSIPVHFYKSSFLDESVVMAELSSAFGERVEALLPKESQDCWTVPGQHSET